MDGVGLVCCKSWGDLCLCSGWMGMDLISLKGVPCPVVCFGVFGDIYWLLAMALYLSASVQSCVPVLLKGWHGVSGARACWSLGRAWY